MRILRTSLVVMVMIAAAARAGESRRALTILPQTFTGGAQLEVLGKAVAGNKGEEAAASAETLLGDHADELVGDAQGGRLSVAAYVEEVGATALVRAAYRRMYDAKAKEMLEGVRKEPGYRLLEMYAVARRYPLSSVAGEARASAGDRALQMGDAEAGRALFGAATRAGWVADDLHGPRLTTLAGLDAGAAFAGAMPCDAPWYNSAVGLGTARIFPVMYGDHIMLYTQHRILAFGLDGKIQWFSEPAPTPTVKAIDPAAQMVRGAMCVPAVLADFSGQAQIIIARQPPYHLRPGAPGGAAAHRDTAFALHAYRAVDGKALWGSEDLEASRDLSFTGPPVIAGRYTYGVALTIALNGDFAKLVLAALDTVSGELLWETELGSYTVGANYAFGERRPWEDAWESSPVSVAGDEVYVAPNAGMVAAVDRFDGKVRWERPYDPVFFGPARNHSLNELKRQTEVARRWRAEEVATTEPGEAQTTVDAALACRWLGAVRVCGDMVVAGPQDSTAVYGLEAGTGYWKWTRGDVREATLVASTQKLAIFAGQNIEAIRAEDGRSAWRWEPPRGSQITGPPTAWGELLLVPTTTGVVTIAMSEGTTVQTPAGAGVFRRGGVAHAEALRPALEEAGAVEALGLKAGQ